MIDLANLLPKTKTDGLQDILYALAQFKGTGKLTEERDTCETVSDSCSDAKARDKAHKHDSQGRDHFVVFSHFERVVD